MTKNSKWKQAKITSNQGTEGLIILGKTKVKNCETVKLFFNVPGCIWVCSSQKTFFLRVIWKRNISISYRNTQRDNFRKKYSGLKKCKCVIVTLSKRNSLTSSFLSLLDSAGEWLSWMRKKTLPNFLLTFPAFFSFMGGIFVWKIFSIIAML